jgi:uncharacterized repeat protein (TIGR02543 family)
LVINEVMTKNDSAYQDTSDPASYDDWVELYNKGTGSVALAGKYLTDDISNPTKWQFPSGVSTLSASSRVIVWCDDDVAQGDYHTNFKLGDGETLYLIDSDGVSILDQVSPPNLAADTSYGRITDGSATWDTFTTSSGNASNGTGSVIVDPPVFEVNSSTTTVSGYFSAVPTIKLSSPDGGTIYYTTSKANLGATDSRYPVNATQTTVDSSLTISDAQKRYGTEATSGGTKLDPSEKNSRPLADDPTTSSTTVASGDAITAIADDAVTVVRAKVVKDGVSSRIITRTFFVGDVNPADSAKDLPTLPMVSFTMNSDDLWKFTALDGSSNYTGTNGLMIYGPKCTAWENFKNHSDNANYNQVGATWERPASVEYFKADGTPGFSGNVTARVFGGLSVNCPKRSFAVELEQGNLDYYFPNDTNQKRKYDGLVLHAQAQNYNQTLNQALYQFNKLAREGVAKSTLDMSDYEPCLVYINGMYWGVYRIQESKGGAFLKEHYGYDSDDVDMWSEAQSEGWITGPVSSEQTTSTSGDYRIGRNAASDVDIAVPLNGPESWGYLSNGIKKIVNNPTSEQTNSTTIPTTGTMLTTVTVAGKDLPFDQWFDERIDTLNMIDCFFWEMYTEKTDTPNKRFFRPRTANGRWRWIGHDYDSSQIRNPTTPSNTSTDKNWVKNHLVTNTTFNEVWALGRLMSNAALKNTILNRSCDLMNTVLLQDSVKGVIGDPSATTPAAGSLSAIYKPEIERDWFRWNGTWDGTKGVYDSANTKKFLRDSSWQLSNWQYEINETYKDSTKTWNGWAQLKPQKFRDSIRTEVGSSVGADSAITLKVNDTAMGSVRISTITPAASTTGWTGTYFQSIPVTISAQPKTGYTFKAWSGASTSTDAVITFTPSASTHTLTATFEAGTRPADSLRITEIAYNPAEQTYSSTLYDGDQFEFVELKNTGSTAVSLTGFKFTKGIHYAFRDGASLAANTSMVLVRNRINFKLRYSSLTSSIYDSMVQYEGALSNSGDTIALVDGNGDAIEEFSYNDSGSWPVTADGGDYTLNRTDETAGKGGQAESWSASAAKGGTPGSDNSASTTAKLVVSEVSYHTDSPKKDTVEIYNPTSSEVDIGGWYLTDDKGTPQKYKIPTGTKVPANGYKTIEAGIEVSSQYKFGTSTTDTNLFEFSEFGEEVYLFSGASDALTGYSNGFSFGDGANAANTNMGSDTGAGSTAIPYTTSSTDGARRVITLAKKPTLGEANAAPLVGPVVISEIMFNGTSGAEWIELKNITNAEVKLYDDGTNTEGTQGGWKVTGIDHVFVSGDKIPANGVLVLVPSTTTISTFRSDNSVPSEVTILQWPADKTLDDSGEKLELKRPGKPEASPSTYTPYYTMDEVDYKITSPWPTGASGTGKSIERITLTDFGDDASNWQVSASSGGTPGTAETPEPDTTAPTNTSGWPKADTATSDGFTVRAKINEAGTAYYVVVADGATAPSVAQVKAGQNSGGSAALKSGSITLSANTEGTAAVTGLSASTAYDVYVVAQDDESTPNVQASVTKVDISTTTATPELIVYEKADYTASATKPDSDGGLNSGNGFPASGTATTGTGLKTTSADGWGADITVASDGLTYTDGSSNSLSVGGKALIFTAEDWSAKVAQLYSGVSSDPFGSYRTTADQSLDAANKEVWISLLMKVSDTTKRAMIICKDNSGANLFAIGLNGSTGKWSIGQKDLGGYSDGPSATANTTALLLVKITYGASGAASTDDKVELWVNPSLTGTLGAASATYSSMNADLCKFQPRSQTGAPDFTFDELRIGTTQASVLPTATSLTPIESWRNTNFSQTASSGDAADTADPDGDGIVNLMEYALTDTGTSLDPDVASTVGLPTVTVESSKLKMAFKRNTSATDVKYEIQASTNLTDWTTIATWGVGATEWTEVASGASASESPAGTVSVTDSTEIASGTPRFLRLKVTLP